MRLIFYFLILVNIVILLFNWDDFTNRNLVYSNIQEGETLKLASEQQVPARALAQQSEPQPQPNPAARGIDAILDIMSSIGNILSGIFRDDQYPLPEPEDTPSTPPPPIRPQTADYCINIGDYDSLAAAEALSANLASYQISNSVETKPLHANSFTVIALVRSDLGVAMELSELLLENGIRNSVKENKPLGYTLVTNRYSSEAQAIKILDRIKQLGLSARLTKEKGKATKNNYFIHLDKSAVPQLERLPNLTELKNQVVFTEIPDC